MILKKIFTSILIGFSCLFSTALADDLTTGTIKDWPFPDCSPCGPCAMCPPESEMCDSICSHLTVDNITLDLIDPVYDDGVLYTEKGGVLTGPGLRIQARKIIYKRKMEADPPEFQVHCEGDLLIDYKNKVLAGSKLDFDFITNTGVLYDGKTSIPPWNIGGEEILLKSNGNLTIYNGYVTTCEGCEDEWSILAPKIKIFKNQILSAHNVNIRFSNVPLLWMPTMKVDLKSVAEPPISVRFSWGGFQGSKLSLRYNFLSWEDFNAYARLDGYIKRGLGGGIETEYVPCDSWVEFYTRNYYAHDISINDPVKRNRYRFEGTYFNRIWNDRITVNLVYDKVSDPDMASDYQAKDFDLLTAGRTELEFRQEECNWIWNFFTNVRINSFQTVNQNLPSFDMGWRPFELGSTGIISENYFNIGYYDYAFSEDIQNTQDFHSGRVAAYPKLYRPFYTGPWTITPEAGVIAIGYSNSPIDENDYASSHDAVGLLTGKFGLDIETTLSKSSSCVKHVIEPYSNYRIWTPPTSNVDEHYIFNIYDAYAYLNMMRVGARNTVFLKEGCDIKRLLYVDLFANLFFDSDTQPLLPKAYVDMELYPFSTLTVGMDTAWNFQNNLLDYYNVRTLWTLSEDLAFALEYRHRSQYDWRKADYLNFFLEEVRTEDELLVSPLSDRRDTLLGRVFYRINPEWKVKFQIRHGFKRPNQSDYTEYQVDVGTLLKHHLKLNFMYEKRTDDHRFSVSMKLGNGPPKRRKR